ncbi:hypothetical protein SPAR52_2199 [Streptococcus pneumoniae GA17971]|nr:hypothetical protein SPAR52_2199 [Streptococcus pneumoniae GA17971]
MQFYSFMNPIKTVIQEITFAIKSVGLFVFSHFLGITIS